MERDTPEPTISQRRDELARMIVDGKRTDDGETCSLVLLRKTGGQWCLYPHGIEKFGVVLADAEARRMAQTILDGGQ